MSHLQSLCKLFSGLALTCRINTRPPVFLPNSLGEVDREIMGLFKWLLTRHYMCSTGERSEWSSWPGKCSTCMKAERHTFVGHGTHCWKQFHSCQLDLRSNESSTTVCVLVMSIGNGARKPHSDLSINGPCAHTFAGYMLDHW